MDRRPNSSIVTWLLGCVHVQVYNFHQRWCITCSRRTNQCLIDHICDRSRPHCTMFKETALVHGNNARGQRKQQHNTLQQRPYISSLSVENKFYTPNRPETLVFIISSAFWRNTSGESSTEACRNCFAHASRWSGRPLKVMPAKAEPDFESHIEFEFERQEKSFNQLRQRPQQLSRVFTAQYP